MYVCMCMCVLYVYMLIGSYCYISKQPLHGAGDLSTTRALEKCNRYVLTPYNRFLKVVSCDIDSMVDSTAAPLCIMLLIIL